MTRVLVSVRSASEAAVAVAHGADLVDAKEPARGALGALPLDTIREIVATVGGARPVSATVGDLPLDPRVIIGAVQEVADTGVDIVKIGFFADADRNACLPPLAPIARRQPLVAVLFADQEPDLDLIPRIAGAGFVGVMLDTADKSRGSLTAQTSLRFLASFVAEARREGLLAGLAGSLRLADIETLRPLGVTYLGFRGALCDQGDRSGTLDPSRLDEILLAVNSELIGTPVTSVRSAT
jgi:(5-formylfuran-3-yl)methyl phosphate synthase